MTVAGAWVAAPASSSSSSIREAGGAPPLQSRATPPIAKSSTCEARTAFGQPSRRLDEQQGRRAHPGLQREAAEQTAQQGRARRRRQHDSAGAEPAHLELRARHPGGRVRRVWLAGERRDILVARAARARLQLRPCLSSRGQVVQREQAERHVARDLAALWRPANRSQAAVEGELAGELAGELPTHLRRGGERAAHLRRLEDIATVRKERVVELHWQVDHLHVEGHELRPSPPAGQRVEVGRVEPRRLRVDSCELRRGQHLRCAQGARAGVCKETA